MIGMNTRMIDSPAGIIYHTPVRDLFKPYVAEKTWYIGEKFPNPSQTQESEESTSELIEQIISKSLSIWSSGYMVLHAPNYLMENLPKELLCFLCRMVWQPSHNHCGMLSVWLQMRIISLHLTGTNVSSS